MGVSPGYRGQQATASAARRELAATMLLSIQTTEVQAQYTIDIFQCLDCVSTTSVHLEVGIC